VVLAASMREIRYSNTISVSNVKGTVHLRDLGVNLKILSEPIPVQPQLTLSRVRMTYKRGFGLDDWIYCTFYIHNTGLQAIHRYC
jgi:hypothetical protein